MSAPMDASTHEKLLLVEYSSSPPPLIEDHSGLPEESDVQLHNQLKLSTYEYAALEERYRTLSGKYRELRKLASGYYDVIRGSPSYEEEDVSLDQLRIEAGHEGFRAKALEVDALRPIVRDAGGLEALTSQLQSLGWLIEQTGGMGELQELVEDARMLRSRVDAVGGLHSFDQLVAEVNRLRAEQQPPARLGHNPGGNDSMKVKALKYDMLQQAFIDIQRRPAGSYQAGPKGAGPKKVKHASKTVIPPQGLPAATSLDRAPLLSSAPPHGVPAQPPGAMNPDRARLLSSAPSPRDPDRRLYEPPPPPSKPTTKTGSNQEPLGPPRRARQSGGQENRESDSLKRKQHEELTFTLVKRPRVDLGRASALLQPTLSSATTRPGISNGIIKMEEPKDQPTMVPDLASSAEIVIKQEVPEEGHDPRPSDYRLGKNLSAHDSTSIMVDNHPIALWVGSGDPNSDITSNLIRVTDIPLALARFLAYNINKHIQGFDDRNWLTMPPNSDTCVLRYILDRHRPSGQPQERRACRHCTSVWVAHHRACALLQEIDGVRTVVFVPLKEALRRGVQWTEKSYWVTGAK
ncbi:hypothetical protein FB567DRAFT_111161 [Paraphoma chrysanthemicola]|uniref:Uncharacterized protein n=1 Tax=Paraphoma chrysanthemicola TaxID=798071 RepID=A0A8K0VVL7_9PLEO|nr:hypothetical protein FB567DRAFT_111161 [Paraphoma chrysanthemicola]